MRSTLMRVINGGPISPDGRYWQKRAPLSLQIDPSCRTVPAIYDPAVRKLLIEAYKRSINPKLPNGVAEHGFHVTQEPGSQTFSPGSIITSGQQRRINGLKIRVAQPKNAVLFAHTHPNNRPPSEIDDYDRSAATQLGTPVAAIDGSGRVYCALPGAPLSTRR